MSNKAHSLTHNAVAISESNRNAWNNVTVNHRGKQFDHFVSVLKSKDGVCLTADEKEIFSKLDISDKSIGQLGCNNGRELLSLKKLGAGDCVGFDISDAAIQYARDLSDVSGIPCRFVRSDIYAINHNELPQFDILYVSVGVIGWLPNLPELFRKIADLLKPGGQLFIHELHPILDMFLPDNECSKEDLKEAPKPQDSYFRNEPFIDTDGIDYVSHTQYPEGTEIWFHHRLDDIIMAAIKAGLVLQFFKEGDKDISALYARLEESNATPPMSCSLIFIK